MKIISVSLILILLASNAWANVTLKRQTGYAYNQENGELLYKELHQLFVEDGQVTSLRIQYADPQDVVFAEKNLDFRNNEKRPSFILADQRHGYIEGLIGDAPPAYTIFCQEGFGEPLQSSTVKPKREFVADAGFDRVIERYWDELLSGEKLKFDYLVPAKMDFFKFRLSKVEELTYQGVPAVRFRMSAANALIRIFAPAIDVIYDVEEKQLLQYQGISNMRDKEMENYQVTIEFPIEERTSETAEGFSPIVVTQPQALTASAGK